MKIRADIAALIRAGHTNTSIAHRLHVHRDTVAKARRALQLPPAKRLERLYAEAIPTGRVKQYRPNRMPTSPAQQAANLARLTAALRETT